MVEVFKDFENEVIAHILLACGVHWIVETLLYKSAQRLCKTYEVEIKNQVEENIN